MIGSQQRACNLRTFVFLSGYRWTCLVVRTNVQSIQSLFFILLLSICLISILSLSNLASIDVLHFHALFPPQVLSCRCSFSWFRCLSRPLSNEITGRTSCPLREETNASRARDPKLEGWRHHVKPPRSGVCSCVLTCRVLPTTKLQYQSTQHDALLMNRNNQFSCRSHIGIRVWHMGGTSHVACSNRHITRRSSYSTVWYGVSNVVLAELQVAQTATELTNGTQTAVSSPVLDYRSE